MFDDIREYANMHNQISSCNFMKSISSSVLTEDSDMDDLSLSRCSSNSSTNLCEDVILGNLYLSAINKNENQNQQIGSEYIEKDSGDLSKEILLSPPDDNIPDKGNYGEYVKFVEDTSHRSCVSASCSGLTTNSSVRSRGNASTDLVSCECFVRYFTRRRKGSFWQIRAFQQKVSGSIDRSMDAEALSELLLCPFYVA